MDSNTSVAVKLPWGSAYYIAITALNQYGESGYSNIEYFSIPEAYNPNSADLWIELKGNIYGIPQYIKDDLYIKNQSGEQVAPDKEIAGKLFASDMMLSQIEETSFNELDTTLSEVISSASIASVVNSIGEFSEKGLSTLAQAAVQPVLAPATGGTSASACPCYRWNFSH